MSREFSIRVSGELAGWVRRQGSPQEVIETLAVLVARGKLPAEVTDPGPGPERLTVRFPVSGLPKLRRLTRSRQNLVAFRKLIAAGCRNRALSASRPVPALRSEPVRALALPEPLALTGSIREAERVRYLSGTSPLMQNSANLAQRRQVELITAGDPWGAVYPQANLAQRRQVERARRLREILKFWFWPVIR